PAAKNPSERLSGDQNGKIASSVSGSGCAVVESRERTHNRDRPPTLPAKTILRPSGEMASDIGSLVGGVVMSSRIIGRSRTGRVRNASMPNTAAAVTMAAATGIAHGKPRHLGVTAF